MHIDPAEMNFTIDGVSGSSRMPISSTPIDLSKNHIPVIHSIASGEARIRNDIQVNFEVFSKAFIFRLT
jgi:hypothetical protein